MTLAAGYVDPLSDVSWIESKSCSASPRYRLLQFHPSIRYRILLVTGHDYPTFASVPARYLHVTYRPHTLAPFCPPSGAAIGVLPAGPLIDFARKVVSPEVSYRQPSHHRSKIPIRSQARGLTLSFRPHSHLSASFRIVTISTCGYLTQHSQCATVEQSRHNPPSVCCPPCHSSPGSSRKMDLSHPRRTRNPTQTGLLLRRKHNGPMPGFAPKSGQRRSTNC